MSRDQDAYLPCMKRNSQQGALDSRRYEPLAYRFIFQPEIWPGLPRNESAKPVMELLRPYQLRDHVDIEGIASIDYIASKRIGHERFGFASMHRRPSRPGALTRLSKP